MADKWLSNEKTKKEFDPIADKIVELHKAVLIENGILKAKIESQKLQIKGLRDMLKENKNG